jgi:hypothetical protein
VTVEAGGTLVTAEQVPPASHVAASGNFQGVVERGQERRAGDGAKAWGGVRVFEGLEGNPKER